MAKADKQSGNGKTRKPKLGKWWILLAAILLGVVFSLVNFLVLNPSKEYTVAGLDLLYDGAADGLAPDGEVFLIDNIKNEDILTAAIAQCGLADTITPEELSRNLIIRGSYPEDIIEQIKSFDSLLASDPTRQVRVSEYYPTHYNIYIYNRFSRQLSGTQLNDLLAAVLAEYKIAFTNLYNAGIDWSVVDDLCVEKDYDYIQQLSLLSTRLDVIRRYARELNDAEPTFALSDGTSFNTILLQCDTLTANDFESLYANIFVNALSKNISRLREQYEFELVQLNFELETARENLTKINGLIADYEVDSTLYMSAGESLITVEGNSRSTYDAMVQQKVDVANRISAIQIEIADYESKIADLDANNGVGGEDVEESIAALTAKVDSLAAEFERLADAYNAKYVSSEDVQVSEVKYYGNSIGSMAYIVALVKSEAPLCALALVLILCLVVLRETRKGKRGAKGSSVPEKDKQPALAGK